MSGHSKWSQIKRQKGRTDIKRSSVFTKLSHVIAQAARDGADPTMNFKLRLAIEKARAANMPNDNIERAVQRGSGTGGALSLEEIAYEVFGPEGVALIVTALTDNRNRTTNDVRSVLNKYGGTLANSGSVSWMFETHGVLRIATEHLTANPQELELVLIDAGVDDVQLEPEGMTILTPPARLEAVRNLLAQRQITVDEAGIELIPKTTATPTPTAREQLVRLREELEAIDDIQSVFTNAGE